MNGNGSHDPILEADPPQELAPFSPDFFEANIAAQQQLINQHYANWQQALGGLHALIAMRDLALKQL